MENEDQIRLFDGESLVAYLDARQRSVSSLVDNISREQFLATSTDTLRRQVVDQLSIAPLVLHLDQMQRQQADTKISMMVDAKDYGMPVRRQEMVRAYKMSYIIPFSGEALLWQLNNGPRLKCLGAIDIERSLLTLTLQNTPDIGSSWYQRKMEETMNQIDRFIWDQTNTLAQFHGKLAEEVERAVVRRRQQIQA